MVRDPEVSARELNHDLEVINNWANQWKMSFNPDPTKPAEEILFSHKRRPITHPPLFFNGVEVKRVSEHKHLGLILDPLLNFASHFNEKIAKARKGIGLIKHLQSYLPTSALDQIYKMCVRSHLDYCDFIFHIPALNNENNVDEIEDEFVESEDETANDIDDDDENYDEFFNFNDEDQNFKDVKLNFRMKTLESLQYQAALAVTGAWKGTSTDKIYKELGWESLHHRRCFRRITQFFKIMKGLTPQYLLDPIPMPRRHLFGRHTTNDLYKFRCRNRRFQNSFYPDAVKSWNNLGPEIRNIDKISKFKEAVIKTIQPQKRSIFNVHDPNGIRHIYQLRVGLSPLRAHKKRHNFIDTPDDICRCGTGIETTEHFLMNCPLFKIQRDSLLSVVNPFFSKLKAAIPTLSSNLAQILLYGNENLNPSENSSILKATIDFIRTSERFVQL